MTLTSLRPRKPTDLVRLSGLLQRQNAERAALPRALPEPLLLSVARDLRTMDQPDGADSSMAAPLMLVICLLMGGGRPAPMSELTISESALYDSLRVYQWAVEREIVTRITGIGGQDDEATLLSKLTNLNEPAAA